MSSANFVRARGVPIALRVEGGISHLLVDGKRYQNVGARRFISKGFTESADRLELDVLGGASTLEIRTR